MRIFNLYSCLFWKEITPIFRKRITLLHLGFSDFVSSTSQLEIHLPLAIFSCSPQCGCVAVQFRFGIYLTTVTPILFITKKIAQCDTFSFPAGSLVLQKLLDLWFCRSYQVLRVGVSCLFAWFILASSCVFHNWRLWVPFILRH